MKYYLKIRKSNMKMEIIFLYICLSTIWLTVESQINVALHSEVTSCNSTPLPRINDGNRNITFAERFYEKCGSEPFIDMRLGENNYKINYVVVYEGTPLNAEYNQLDYFRVVKVRVDQVRELCGEFPSPSTGPVQDKGMRVNCNSTMLSKTYSILLYFPKNEGFSIAEIEAYTFDELGQILIRRGCLGSFRFDYSIAMVDFKFCVESCSRLRYTYMAVNTKTCNCVNAYDIEMEIPSEICNTKCVDSDEMCGGKEANSLYVVTVYLPSYVSCRMPIDTFQEKRYRHSNGLSSCLLMCQSYKYAFIKDGSSCRCDDEITGSVNSSAEQCDSPCPENSDLYCGGANRVSVYTTCFGRQVTPCSLLLRCDANWDHYGVCKDCEEGFIGIHCIERGVKVSTPLTSGNVDSSFKMSTKIMTYKSDELSKIMSTSLITTNENDETRDDGFFTSETTSTSKILMCPFICYMLPNTECKPFKGKYVCDCKEGFKRKKNKFICIDIDECIYSPCDTKYSTCKNIKGGHTCDCKENYVKAEHSDDICKKIETPIGNDPFVFLSIIFGLVILIVIILIMHFFRRADQGSDLSETQK